MRSVGLAQKEIIEQKLTELASFNATPGKGITRVALSDEDMAARSIVKQWMNELDLEIREDALGNIFGRLSGSNSSLPPIWTGSHIDTVLHGGKFDGMIGVIGALEAVRLIKETESTTQRNIEVVVFTAEEPTAFGMGCLGSRAVAGELKQSDLQSLNNSRGATLYKQLKQSGFIPEDLPESIRSPDSIRAFLELHIEQGAVLESLNCSIGLVTTICAPTDLHVRIVGKQAHAGATPMNLRQDAFMAASEVALYIEELAVNSKSPHTVGTVGKVMVHPNASNVIPGEVNLTVDLRDSDFNTKDQILKEFYTFIKELEKRREVQIQVEQFNHDVPENCNSSIVDLLVEACEDRKIPFHKMVSGAYHDAMHIARIAPIGMIFVPSKDGISHNPKEWTETIDIVKGVNILTDTIYYLANH